jgi:hypothetical protein
VLVGEISLSLADTWPSVRKREILRFKMNVRICISMAKRERDSWRQREREERKLDLVIRIIMNVELPINNVCA